MDCGRLESNPFSHEGPSALPAVEEPAGFQFPVRLHHGVRIDRQPRNHIAHRGKLVTGLESSQPYRVLDLAGDLQVGRKTGIGLQVKADHVMAPQSVYYYSSTLADWPPNGWAGVNRPRQAARQRWRCSSDSRRGDPGLQAGDETPLHLLASRFRTSPGVMVRGSACRGVFAWRDRITLRVWDAA